jgi:hypothetical protein
MTPPLGPHFFFEERMRKTLSFRAVLSAAALLTVTAPARAQVTVYHTLASFLTAVGTNATDTFSDISVSTLTPGPLSRNVGSFHYNIGTNFFDPSADRNFRGVATAANPALAINIPANFAVLNGFSSGVRAFGGNFWNTNADASVAFSFIDFAVQYVTGGGQNFRIDVANPGDFWGVLVTNPIDFVIFASDHTTSATMDNFILAAAPTGVVPEPVTVALFGGGLLCLGVVSRRRRTR